MKIKNKKCRNCGKEFTPFLSTQKACSQSCAISIARMKLQKDESLRWSAEKKQRKEALMSHAEWLKTLQVVFNTYIRERDKNEPCISCGTTKGQMHCGHYRSVSVAPQLRFNEDNCSKQCARCNTYLSGNLINYRIGLVKKIGLKKVEQLEKDNSDLKLSIPEIKEKITYYKQKIKDLKCNTNR